MCCPFLLGLTRVKRKPALKKHWSDSPKKEAPQFSENLVVKKSESTRKSSAKAFRINQLYELQREFTSQKGVSKRAAIGKDDEN